MFVRVGERTVQQDTAIFSVKFTTVLHVPQHSRSLSVAGLHDLEVYVGNSENVTDNTLCTRLLGHPDVLDVRIVCDKNLSGRYVGIVLRTRPGKPESLILCEALVYLM
ncbi:hypothetical protein ACOMHN_029397 [Nucella lapillus]